MNSLSEIARQNIRKARQQRGYSTNDLAEITGISQSAISKIENGKRKIDLCTLETICNALHVKIQNIICE